MMPHDLNNNGKRSLPIHRKMLKLRRGKYVRSMSVIGRRREMEDSVAIEEGFIINKGLSNEYDFFGVYDGHGGSLVAQACRQRLHELVIEQVGDEGGDDK
ncbi:hypothetical protein LIER_37401 [Lithospermum erythrorhizon]|uniref:protein-serine/threonine phosphatase n=1 Tax=Lithospermum erythrorhizon TaxID=34254 RepID=A0AAV3PLC9_LITER